MPCNFDGMVKRRHYFIYSKEPNFGKTYFINNLESKFRCYRYDPFNSY